MIRDKIAFAFAQEYNSIGPLIEANLLSKPQVLVLEVPYSATYRGNSESLYSLTMDLKRKGYSSTIVKMPDNLLGVPHKKIRTFLFLWRGRKVCILNVCPNLTLRESLNRVSSPGKIYRRIPERLIRRFDLELASVCLTREKLYSSNSNVSLNSLLRGLQPSCEQDRSIRCLTSLSHVLGPHTLVSIVHPFEDRSMGYREVEAIMGFYPKGKENFAELWRNTPNRVQEYWAYEIEKALEGGISQIVAPPDTLVIQRGGMKGFSAIRVKSSL